MIKLTKEDKEKIDLYVTKEIKRVRKVVSEYIEEYCLNSVFGFNNASEIYDDSVTGEEEETLFTGLTEKGNIVAEEVSKRICEEFGISEENSLFLLLSLWSTMDCDFLGAGKEKDEIIEEVKRRLKKKGNNKSIETVS